MKRKFACVYEGQAEAGCHSPLSDIYTELYITECIGADVNTEHEIRQIEMATRRPTADTPVHCSDIFKLTPGAGQPV